MKPTSIFPTTTMNRCCRLFIRTTWILFCATAVLATGCAEHKKLAVRDYPYHEPLSSPGQKFSGLPPAVQTTIRAQVGGADIYDIEKLGAASEPVYKIIFRDTALFPPLYVAPSGSVLYPDLKHVAVGAGRDDIGAVSGGAVSGLRMSDLPQKVVSTIQQKAPTAEVKFINKTVVNGRAFFEVTFKDPERNPKLVVAEDGTLANQTW